MKRHEILKEFLALSQREQVALMGDIRANYTLELSGRLKEPVTHAGRLRFRQYTLVLKAVGQNRVVVMVLLRELTGKTMTEVKKIIDDMEAQHRRSDRILNEAEVLTGVEGIVIAVELYLDEVEQWKKRFRDVGAWVLEKISAQYCPTCGSTHE